MSNISSMKLTLLELKQSKTGVMQRLAIGYGLTIVRLLKLLEGVRKSLLGSANRFLLYAQVMEKPQPIVKKSTHLDRKIGQAKRTLPKATLTMSQLHSFKNSSQTTFPKMENWTRTVSSIQSQSLTPICTLSATTIQAKRLKEVLEFYAKNTSLIGLT